MVDRKYNIVSGTAYWASVAAPNTTFDSDGSWMACLQTIDADRIPVLAITEIAMCLPIDVVREAMHAAVAERHQPHARVGRTKPALRIGD